MGIGKERDESPLEYKIRICDNRELYGLTWDELAKCLNEEFGENFGESKYRKWWYAFQEGMSYVNEKLDEQKRTEEEFCGSKHLEHQILPNNQQGSTILCRLTEEQKKDNDYILELHGYDPDKWEIVNAKQSIWNTKKGDVISDLYSSKITVKPRTGFNWNLKNVEDIFSNLERNRNLKKQEDYGTTTTINSDKSGKMLVVPICDLHYGLKSEQNVAGEEYNMNIAESRFMKVIDDVINRTKNEEFNQILLVVGNDFINSDNIFSTTTKGTPQNSETNWFEIIEKAIQLIIKGAEKLRGSGETKNKVHITSIIANHDMHSMFGVIKTLGAYYRNDEDITVDNSVLPRKYFVFGNNLIGFAHDEKMAEVPKIMAAEQATVWGQTTYKTFFLAHLHKEQVVEDIFGVDIRRLPTISGRSKWSNDQGYVGTNKKNQSFIFDEEYGLTDILSTIIK